MHRQHSVPGWQFGKQGTLLQKSIPTDQAGSEIWWGGGGQRQTAGAGDVQCVLIHALLTEGHSRPRCFGDGYRGTMTQHPSRVIQSLQEIHCLAFFLLGQMHHRWWLQLGFVQIPCKGLQVASVCFCTFGMNTRGRAFHVLHSFMLCCSARMEETGKKGKKAHLVSVDFIASDTACVYNIREINMAISHLSHESHPCSNFGR